MPISPKTVLRYLTSAALCSTIGVIVACGQAPAPTPAPESTFNGAVGSSTADNLQITGPITAQSVCDYINTNMAMVAALSNSAAQPYNTNLQSYLNQLINVPNGYTDLIACLELTDPDAALAPSGLSTPSVRRIHPDTCPKSWCGAIIFGYPFESACGYTPGTYGCSCLFFKCR